MNDWNKNGNEKMSVERKILILVGILLMLNVAFSMVACGYCVAIDSPHFITWAFSAAASFWIGVPIAEVLRESKNK